MKKESTQHKVSSLTIRCNSCAYLHNEPPEQSNGYQGIFGCSKGHWEGDDGATPDNDPWKFCKDYKWECE